MDWAGQFSDRSPVRTRISQQLFEQKSKFPPSELRGPFDARSIIFSEPRQNVSGHFRIADSIPEFTYASENDSILGAPQGHLIG